MFNIFNKSRGPSIFGHMNFRIAYTLLPAIRNITLSAKRDDDPLNVISIACGAALELSCFEMLSRSLKIKINYLGCDIDEADLKFNCNVLSKRTRSVTQQYLLTDLAATPPIEAITAADCILWRHPEFLSDHSETPKELILNMAHILWNILQNKNRQSPVLITCYDPHEMMLVIELAKLLCENEIEYKLTIDKQDGRASIANPIVSPTDKDPLFNLNNHDQFQLFISYCSPTKKMITAPLLLNHLSRTFQTIISRIPTVNTSQQQEILKQLESFNLDALRLAVSFLNNEIRKNDHPFTKREEFISILSEQVEPAANLNPIHNGYQ